MKSEFDYVEPKFHEYDFKPKGITCDGEPVKFPDLFEPMALALANGGQFMVADWRTAKLMISLMWAGTLLVSAFALVACHRRFATR